MREKSAEVLVRLVILLAFTWFGLHYYQNLEPSKIILPVSSCSPPTFISPTKPKNLIFLLGDGMGIAAVTLARIVKGSKIFWDDFQTGSVKTSSQSSWITDSAAAATAMATGFKTQNRRAGCLPNGTAVGTILEAAKDQGFVIGAISTASVTSASPAGFTSHASDRGQKKFISQQQIDFAVDILLGGGLEDFATSTLEEATAKGYTIITDKSQLEAVDSLPLLGLFSAESLPHELDLPFTDEPSLFEMTKKALELVSNQDKPFALFVEMDGTDDGGHEWDQGSVYRDLLGLETTFRFVIDFAKSRNDTLVLLTSDHETGGLTIGSFGALNINPQIVEAQKRSLMYTIDTLNNEAVLNASIAIEIVQETISITLTEEQATTLVSFFPNNTRSGRFYLGGIMAEKANLYFVTQDHTGVDVNLYGYGPGLQQFCGNMENVDIGRKLADLFQWDLNAVTERLKNFNTTG